MKYKFQGMREIHDVDVLATLRKVVEATSEAATTRVEEVTLALVSGVHVPVGATGVQGATLPSPPQIVHDVQQGACQVLIIPSSSLHSHPY